MLTFNHSKYIIVCDVMLPKKWAMERQEETAKIILLAWKIDRDEDSGRLQFSNSVTLEKTTKFPEGVDIPDDDMQWMFSKEAERKEAERKREAERKEAERRQKLKEEEERKRKEREERERREREEAERKRREREAKEAEARRIREAAEAVERAKQAAIQARRQTNTRASTIILPSHLTVFIIIRAYLCNDQIP